jgi:hypothetical protein
MKYIPLSSGLSCLVDDENHEHLSKHNWNTSRAKKDQFYAQAVIGGKIIRMHRLLCGAKQGDIVDHINGDTLDNRRCNLRIVDTSQNMINSKMRRNNTSGYKGVGFSKLDNKWFAYISVDKKRIGLGRFKDKGDAIAARQKAEKEIYGEFLRQKNKHGVNHTPKVLPLVFQKSRTMGRNGVYKDPRSRADGTVRFIATITCNSKRITLGSFKTFDEAVAAREKAEREYFPEFFKDQQAA